MENRNTINIYYKIYYTHNGQQDFLWTVDKSMVKSIITNIQSRGHVIDYITQVTTKMDISEKTLNVVY